MADILPFKKPKAKVQHQGKTLCKSGFHKWEVMNNNPFDVKSGKMVSRYRCLRCGIIKTEAQ